MPIVQSLLPEYDHELATTRRLLERVPEGEFGWKPHPKSMSLGQLAGHVANIPFWCSATMDAPFYDLAASDDKEARLEAPESRDVLLQEFDRKVAAARASLAKATDAEMNGAVDAEARRPRDLHASAGGGRPLVRHEPPDPSPRAAQCLPAA